ncbi:MAG: cysteine--tRNA ligase [bacterium]|nr:cysteine--tRNA ligase [bacterium]
MSLHLFNTLTLRKEEFKPRKLGEVAMYNCGPTVYNYAHIGNLRAYVFVDVLRRTLEYNNLKVKQVMNVTDVGHLASDADDGDDKMVKALKRENKPFTLEAMREVADTYTKAFVEDLKALNCELPHEMPRASENIKEDIELIKILEEKGIAYKTTDGIYFDISKYPEYGKLGNIKLEGQLAGARVDINSEKKNPADFTLWKISKNDIGWESPWGKGFPGWHIECSAMSRKYLGQPFDIHTGGIDHIPVHHNNEIAQSEAAYDVPLANYWLHNEHLVIAEGKMAKSGENFITLQTLKKRGVHPISYRYFLLQTHYRSPLNFSWEALEAAQTTLERILTNINYKLFPIVGSSIEEEKDKKFRAELEKSNDDDLDTSSLIAILNKILPIQTETRKKLFEDIEKILGLNLEKLSKDISEGIPAEVQKISEERDAYRKKGTPKDWKMADVMRTKLESMGYYVQDFGPESKVFKKLSLLAQ